MENKIQEILDELPDELYPGAPLKIEKANGFTASYDTFIWAHGQTLINALEQLKQKIDEENKKGEQREKLMDMMDKILHP